MTPNRLPSLNLWRAAALLMFSGLTLTHLHAALLPVEIERDASGEGVSEIRLQWPMDPGFRYGLYRSTDLRHWEMAPGFPAEAETEQGSYSFVPNADRGFFVAATLGSSPEGMVLIPAGAYARGDSHDEPETYMEWSRPVREVALSAFYIARTPVPYGDWAAVRNWAEQNGYTFDNQETRGWIPGVGSLPSGAVYDRHPVVNVSWHDVVKWCNARSEMEGLTPAYYTDESHQTVYREGHENLDVTHVDWLADGYRLPTEAEWEKAARGGLTGKRWAWGDEPRAGFRANYAGSRRARGTVPVGHYPSNGYGLYDLAGNVTEWCWDRFRGNWYDEESSADADTRGPSESDFPDLRAGRGGAWTNIPEFARVAFRTGSPPAWKYPGWGFRPVRSAP